MDALRERWAGPGWRRWSFLAGAALAVVTTAGASLLALAIGSDPSSLALLGLGIESIVIALLGAGLLERLSGRMVTGGLARQPHPERTPRGGATDAERERRDRLTIRAGLIVLPVFASFVALLFAS